MHDSVNLPDIILPSDLLWSFSSKNSESGVFCCRLQKTRNRQSVVKTCHKIFSLFHSEICEL